MNLDFNTNDEWKKYLSNKRCLSKMLVQHQGEPVWQLIFQVDKDCFIKHIYLTTLNFNQFEIHIYKKYDNTVARTANLAMDSIPEGFVLHNENGAAQNKNGYKKYFIDGKQYKENEYLTQIKLKQNKTGLKKKLNDL